MASEPFILDYTLTSSLQRGDISYVAYVSTPQLQLTSLLKFVPDLPRHTAFDGFRIIRNK